MFIRILLLAGIIINLDHHINFTENQLMTALVLSGVGIGLDILLEVK